VLNPISNHNNWRSILGYRIDREPEVGDRVRFTTDVAMLSTFSLPPGLAGVVGIVVDPDHPTCYGVRAKQKGHFSDHIWVVPISHWRDYITIVNE
jgi:hypothetical protein